MTVAAGQTAFVLHIPTVEDGDVEDNELTRVTFTQRGGTGFATADLIVAENETIDLPFELATVAGKAVRVPIEVTRSTLRGKEFVATVATVAGTATENVDYQGGPYRIVIPICVQSFVAPFHCLLPASLPAPSVILAHARIQACFFFLRSQRQ